MAKQRKTRKDKQLADMRKKSTPIVAPARIGTYSYSANINSAQNITISPNSTVNTKESSSKALIYRFISTDLRKTLFITLAIVLAQVVLYMIETHTKLF